MFASYHDFIDTKPTISPVRPSLPGTPGMEQLKWPFHVVLVNPISFASIKFVKIALTLDSSITVTNVCLNERGTI